jgi:hypothetical protein
MGQGLRKRAASTKDKSCVLSPISARATIPVEIKNASMLGILLLRFFELLVHFLLTSGAVQITGAKTHQISSISKD